MLTKSAGIWIPCWALPGCQSRWQKQQRNLSEEDILANRSKEKDHGGDDLMIVKINITDVKIDLRTLKNGTVFKVCIFYVSGYHHADVFINTK